MKHKNIKSDDKTKIKGLVFSLYGVQQFAGNFFVQGIASVSSNQIHNQEKQIVGDSQNNVKTQIAQSKHRSKSVNGEVLLGYNAQIADIASFSPMAGVRYGKFDGITYKETGTISQNRTISRKASNKLEAIIGARVLVNPIVQGNIAIEPNVHFIVAQKISGKSPKIGVKLDGQAKSFVANASKDTKTLYNAGVNVNIRHAMLEYGVGYDAYLAKKYIAHQGSLKVRVNF